MNKKLHKLTSESDSGHTSSADSKTDSQHSKQEKKYGDLENRSASDEVSESTNRKFATRYTVAIQPNSLGASKINSNEFNINGNDFEASSASDDETKNNDLSSLGPKEFL